MARVRNPGARMAGRDTGSRRERNKQDKLRRIKEAARRLFYERGFEATTTQAIAEAADIGTGTLFSYVRVKEDLLLMVFLDDLLAVMAGRLGPGWTPQVDAAWRRQTERMTAHIREALAPAP